ncbi:MAG: alpha/beta fold hydrolase [Solirubrobacteraceae bacterium]
MEALAERASDAGQVETSRLAYLRASTYFRTAGVMLMGVPLDSRLVEAYARQTDMFRRAAALMVPAAVVLTGGYDGTAEELYFANGAAALARGYNVLAFDGPGQGAALIERGLVMRADWENVITPVLDYALARPDVDASRVALIGLSLGAHLAPRAASAEHRLAACIADCGAYDLYGAFLERLPGALARPFASGRPWARNAVAKLLQLLAGKPTAGWAVRRGLLVHGVDEPLDFVDALRDFTLAERAPDITCPTWVCDAEGDDISASAPQLVDAMTCETTYVHFTGAEGADDHCEQGARALYHARSFAWLDELLRHN